MPVPKWLLAGLGVVAVFLIGGLLRATMADDSQSTEVGSAAPSSREPVAAPGQSAPQPVYVTVVVAGAPVSPEGQAGPAGSAGSAVSVALRKARCMPT